MSAFPSPNSDVVVNPFPDGQRITLPANEEIKGKLGAYGIKVADRIKLLISEGRISKFFCDFLDHPNNYMIYTKDILIDGEHGHLFPSSLRECSCLNSGNFNRFENTRRTDCEMSMINFCLEEIPPEDLSTLRYLSIGAGELLQDFMNIGKLLRAGYKRIDVVLVDPDYHNDYDTEFYQMNPASAEQHREKNQVLQADFMGVLTPYAIEQNAELIVTFKPSVRHVEGLFHIVQAIDFDDLIDALDDVIFAYDLLDDKGRCFLAFDKYDVEFNKIKSVSKKVFYNQGFDLITISLREEVLRINKEEIHVAFMSSNLNLRQWIEILPSIAQAPCVKRVHLTIPFPKEKRDYLPEADKIKPRFSEESIQKFLSRYFDIDVKVSFIESIDKIKEVPQSFDIITQLFIRDFTHTLKRQIFELKEHQSESCLFFALQGHDENCQLEWDAIWSWNNQRGMEFIGNSTDGDKEQVRSLMS